ncbi:MAG: mycofactocin-coupled SDR family oxidoreductase [Actinobacteria bacterium]|nr:mycofactocin-coupled SDR family oxidoreductase [Actinomycetota bacterium]
MGRVEDKVAFITGAARGQGRSHAVRLAEEGADIIAVDVCKDLGMAYPPATSEDLAETVRQVEAAGRRIVAAEVDVRDVEELRSAVDGGVKELGRLDIVSANAGVSGGYPSKTEDIPRELWEIALEVNLTGVWNTCSVAIPHLIDGGRGGSIVITSSAASLKGYENISHYVSSKHALVGLMRTMTNELGPHRIRVNNIAPSQVDTDMVLNETVAKLFCPHLENPTFDDLAEASMAMHVLPIPWVESIDISNALLFLASDEGRYVTGTTLAVDAGATQH